MRIYLKNCWQKLKTKVRSVSYAKIRILLDFCIITAIGVTIFRNFLFTDSWPAGGDALGIVSRAYIFGRDFRWLYVWRPHSFGFIEVIHGYDFFLMVLYWIFRNPIITAKVFLFLTFIFSGFSSYTLAHWYTKNPTASLAAALVYTLNPWFFTQYTEAHGDILFSYALVPFVFLLIFRVFETKRLKDILVAGLALAIFVSAFHPECLVIYSSSFPIFGLTYVLMPTKNNSRMKQLKNLFKVALPLAIICLGLAAFLFIPMIFNVQPRYYSPTYKYFLEEIYGGVYKNLTDAFTLSAVEVWGYVKVVDVVTGIAVPDLPTKSLSLILFALAYLTVFIRRDKYAVFFVVSALVSMFVAKGPYPPFGDLYVWAWLNIPYFAVFRAANRWIMMTCLSHAFLTASLVDILTRYVKEKKHYAINEAFSRFGAKIAWYFRAKKLKNPLKVAKDFFVRLHKFLYYVSILLLVLIFLNGFFLTWYFFREGLQVYSLPENYMKPYEWIGLQDEDLKVVSVNRDPARWMNMPSWGFDFAFSAMLTNIGWAHDIGFESSFIHDKPAMQDGGWDPNAHEFVDHLRFHLVGQQLTRNFLKMTGLFNYKYVVLPGYTESDIKDFFLNQTGAVGHIVYDENGSLIIENPYYTPRFFGVSSHANILGGYDSFQSLCKIDAFNLNQTNLFFVNKLNGEQFKELQNDAAALVLVNSNLIDLTMLQLRDKTKIMNAADFGVYSYDLTRYWVQWKSWREEGSLVFGGQTLTTVGNVSINIPFEISTNGTCDIWLRIGFLSDRGNLEVSVDDNLIEVIKPEADYWIGLLWVKLQTLDLKEGMHTLTLSNDGSGWNDVDAIAIVEPSLFQSTYDELLSYIESFQGRIVDIIGAANIFGYDLLEGWSIHVQKYENGLLKAENALTRIQENATVSASSIQNGYLPPNAFDGSLQTRWASDMSQQIPQWLMIEWPTPQEIDGVKIFFETAYAKDYTIQTWNGSQWITQVTQVNVTEREARLPLLHMLKEPVETTKLLLNVTAYGTANHLVSIFEFEPCRISSITTRHFTLRQGRYMLALRLAYGPDYGTLNLKIGNHSLSFNCHGHQEKFQWYEAGPFQLERGEQDISASAYGKILFDQMIFYSLNEDENGSVLQNLLGSSFYSPTINYEEINPTAYKVHIRTEQPFFLVFSETYNPLWRAKFDDGQEIQPFIAYSIVNSFYINRTGEFDIQVYFKGQMYADIGLKISLSCLILVATIVIMPKSVIDRIKKRFASWRKNLWPLRSKRR